jgi:hypothetical protein
MKSSLLPIDTVIPSGLMIVGANNQDTLNDARLAILGQAMRAGNALGFQFDQPKKVIDLYAGTPQQQKNILVKSSFCEAPPDGVEYKISMVGSRSGSYNFCGDEAASNVIPMIRAAGASGEKSVILFSQTISNASSLLLADTLNQYRAEAKMAGVLVIVMLACPEGYKKSELPALCEEFIEVDEVEPDFDQDLAMSFDLHSQRGMHRMGIGKTMCSLNYANRRINVSFAPFVCKKSEDRALWYLHCAGRTNAKIAKVVGLHPSNITRNLQKLPRSAPVVMPDVWIKKMLEHFDFEESDADDASKPKSTGHRPPPSIWDGSDDEDSDNDDQEDDDEDDSDDLDDESQEE